MRARVLVCAIVLSACANGRPGSQADGNSSTYEDAGVVEPDGPPKHDFGEPCTSNTQCESGLCILVGTSGQCTQTCGDCPPSYGCLGVTGIQLEGQITFVCVPTSNQLCTTCAQDSECTLIGQDKCVTYPDGDKACAQDCSTVGCPTGFSCNDIVIGNMNYKQCMAASGACDCTAATSGAMQPCNIVTPWNVCVGAQTCAGASGWGSCQPPSMVDDPDANFADSNCDGIDGDRARGIFVSPAGVNSSTCGLDYNSPCLTIAFGISRAQATSRPHIYLQAGTYNATVTMANGISLFGGYDFNWKRQLYSQSGHTVTISGGNPTVRFNAITQPTWLDNVVVDGADATATGGSAIGILATSSNLVELRSVLVQPGSGAAGNGGGNGQTGAVGGAGGQGTPGCENSSGVCSTCSRPVGGLAGASQCGRPGGVGGLPGNGGSCPGGGCGLVGNNGTTASGCPGGPGCGGAGASCGGDRACDGQTGFNGATGGAGPSGTPGSAFGSFSGTSYVTANGGNGQAGNPGNGGGGGGGGGGGDGCCDSFGSSGGGGGGGGCGGTLGSGGSGGGGSFGIVALDSSLTINASLVTSASGGAGGSGGTGGMGGMGGGPGPGGLYGGGSEQDDGGDGAAGGMGGKGGKAGDGGGGGGGPSIAVVCLGTSSSGVSILGTTLTPGSGGTGGMSGAPGAAGTSVMTYGCQ